MSTFYSFLSLSEGAPPQAQEAKKRYPWDPLKKNLLTKNIGYFFVPYIVGSSQDV